MLVELLYFEKMRVEYKVNERKPSKEKNQITWFNQFMNKPVLILGAEISVHETDLWLALINRERNFAKKINIGHKNPVFKMQDESKKDYRPSDIDILCQKLTNKKVPFSNQWDILIDLMNSPRL